MLLSSRNWVSRVYPKSWRWMLLSALGLEWDRVSQDFLRKIMSWLRRKHLVRQLGEPCRSRWWSLQLRWRGAELTGSGCAQMFACEAPFLVESEGCPNRWSPAVGKLCLCSHSLAFCSLEQAAQHMMEPMSSTTETLVVVVFHCFHLSHWFWSLSLPFTPLSLILSLSISIYQLSLCLSISTSLP